MTCIKYQQFAFSQHSVNMQVIGSIILFNFITNCYGVYLSEYKYETKTFQVPVDHFSFANDDTFQMQYLINNTWLRKNKKNPPIFFYTGNEGPIEAFAENTGFMWEVAPFFGALIVFAEHRYYGKSMPYGNESFSNEKNLGYLTSQQALADYVDLITFLKSTPPFENSPVIAFGGSYGGMLSAWFRMKYPHIIQGAIAASAPILQFSGVTECEPFYRIVTSDFKAVSLNCAKSIRKSWDAINNYTSTDGGKKWLSDTWKLCKPLNNETDLKQLKDYLTNVYVNLAMANYPYAANFLTPLPGHPIVTFCEPLENISSTQEELLVQLKEALNVYANFTGETKCIETGDATPGLTGAQTGWDYQSCTEMVMPLCTDGNNDMFEPQPWDFDKYVKDCQEKFKFNIKPQLNFACKTYGCQDLSTATNIVFSNGLLDPWSSGGVFKNWSSSAVSIIIPEGAHHLDLRASNPSDPYSVVQARVFHRSSISKWIKQYHASIINF